MMLNKEKIGILERSFAVRGFKYYFLGLSEKCEECEYKSVCSNLKEGALYEVIEPKDKKTRCLLVDDETEVILARVVEVPILVAVPQKKSFGTVFEYNAPECDPRCEYYSYCVKPTILNNKKLRIVDRIKNFTCPKTKEMFTLVKAYVEE